MRSAARPVEESNFAIMLFDDLLYDRESEASPPHPRCHIGLTHPLAVLRKSNSRIQYVNAKTPPLPATLPFDTVSPNAMLPPISPSSTPSHPILPHRLPPLTKHP